VIVNVEVSPARSALSDITTLEKKTSLVSSVYLQVLGPASGALPARSARVVPTLITLVASSMSSVGVKVPVQVTPPSALLTAESVPF
jgi:hypothetical protein